MKRHCLLLFLVALFFSCSKEEPEVEIQQGYCIPFYVSDTYKYPILPGTDEWKTLSSLEEKVNACQIPQKNLKSISTEGLLETLLNYPLICDYIFFDNLQNGFNRVKTENNGFAELYNREDVFDVITERYELMSFNCGDIYPPKTGDKPMLVEIAFQTFEFFIFQDEFLEKLNANQLYRVFDLVYKKLQDKKEAEVDDYNKLVSMATLGKIMCKSDFLSFVSICDEISFMKFFIEKIPMYRPVDVVPFAVIEQYANEFLIER